MSRYPPNWLQPQTYPALTDRQLLAALWPNPASSGAAVTISAPGTMSVQVASGQVAVPTVNAGTALCTSYGAPEVVGPLSQAPASGNNRIDLIVCRLRASELIGGSNDDFIYDFVTGTPALAPAVPATPAYCVALARIYLAGGSASIDAPGNSITDVRPGGLSLGTVGPSYASFSINAGAAQAITAATIVKLTTAWTAAPVYNYGPGTWSSGLGVYTVGQRGLYRCGFTCTFALGTAFATPNTVFGAYIYVNNVQVTLSNQLYVVNLSTGVQGTATATRTLLLNAGDQVDFRAFNGHGTLNFSTNPTPQATNANIDQLPVAA